MLKHFLWFQIFELSYFSSYFNAYFSKKVILMSYLGFINDNVLFFMQKVLKWPKFPNLYIWKVYMYIIFIV